ncbi:MoaD/ThiS family protein [Zhaonella formicivorans]|uniref:MoaD/ThiS family protein n=1 Tax=Zhaonella formicivorans TaxID=2528593 RepID=UPI001D1233C5|nr:MoaD/ThiS family protein [Zhaonella formicivorans]
MIKIVFKYLAGVEQHLVNAPAELELDEHTPVSKVLEFLSGLQGEKMEQFFNAKLVILNGKNIRYLDGYQTTLQEDGTITIMPLLAGG